MPVLLELPGFAALGASPYPALLAEVSMDDPVGLAVDVELDLTVPTAARPAGLRPQVTGYRIYLDGARVPPEQILSCSTRHGMELSSTWSLAVAIPSAFGAPADYLGAPPGKRRIDIYGAYLTATGIHELPEIINGQVDSARPSLAENGTRTMTLAGGDAGLRYDNREVEVVLPPGHGLNRGAVVNRLAAAAGVPSRAIPPGGRMDHALIAVGEPWGPLAREILDVDGLVPIFDRRGILSAISEGYNPSRRVDLYLTDIDITGGIDPDVSGDIVTRVTVTGQAQVVREDGGGRRTEVQESKSYSVYSPKVAAKAQNGDGSLSATGLVAEAATLRLTGKTRSVREWRGDTLLSESEFVWGYYNPQAARYALNADGSLDYVAGVFLYDSGASFEDDALSYLWRVERFVLTHRADTVYTFDERGFRTGEVTRKQSPFMLRAAIKARASSADPWEETDWFEDRFVLGNRSGVAGDPGSFPREILPTAIFPPPPIFTTEMDVVRHTVNDAGYKEGARTEHHEYFAPSGSLFLFAGANDGETPERAQAVESFGLRTVEEIFYLGDLGGGHSETTIKSREGVVIEVETKHGLGGYLPAAERALELTPPAELYDSEIEAEAAKAASMLESSDISAEYISYPLEAHHERSEATASARFAETPGELAEMGRRAVVEGAALGVSITLAGANFLIDRGWRVRQTGILGELIYGEYGLAVDLFVREVTTNDPGRGPILTTASGRVYLAVA